MFNFNKQKNEFASPISGKTVAITGIQDPVFSKKLMGDGFGIIPSSQVVAAPSDGEVSFCFPTNHAVGIKTTNGLEYLIHIGIDTVNLKGEGFKAFITQGQQVKKGDKLIEFDLEALKSKGYDLTVIVIFPNNSIKNFKSNQIVEIGTLLDIT